MVSLTRYLTWAVLAAAGSVFAHPGEDFRAEFQSREEHLNNNPERRTLGHCSRQLEESGHYAKELARRMEKIDNLKIERGLNGTSGPLNARQQRAGCVLDPEVTEGPFWVAGELIRPDIREGGGGVTLHLDINVIDVTTCKPITNAYVELWGCNSTGVYTGVLAKGNGNGPDVKEEIKNSALRGVQPTNENGTASFVTLVPGHYVGRTNHLHTIIHHGATKRVNNTIEGGTISHVGQFYFDQKMLQDVEKTKPYSTNTQEWMQNSADMLMRQGSANGDNPVVEITLLGGSVEDGLHGVIDVGVNPQARRNPRPVNMWTKDGGVPATGSPWKGYPWTQKVRRWLGL